MKLGPAVLLFSHIITNCHITFPRERVVFEEYGAPVVHNIIPLVLVTFVSRANLVSSGQGERRFLRSSFFAVFACDLGYRKRPHERCL